jgi:hypothetical protein
MKTPSLVLLILGCAVSPAQAQVSQEWVARYASATPYSDIPYAMTVDAAGHVYVTGTAATAGANDWATIKYNSAGVQEWLRTLNGGGSDAAVAITTDEAGNVYVTGSSAGGLYSMTAKYSAAGDQLWVQSFTTIGEGDAGVDIALDHDGNVYVTGYNVETVTGLDIVTIKYSPGGAELWVRRYDSGSGEDVPAAIACDASGIYVTGRSGGSFTTIKYDFNGVQQWVRNYNGGHGSDSPADLIVDAAGNIYVTGQSTGAGTNDDYATIKYDAVGTQQWVRRYDGPTTVFANADERLSRSRTATCSLPATVRMIATVKYDAAGIEIWVRRYNGQGLALIGSDRGQRVRELLWAGRVSKPTTRRFATLSTPACAMDRALQRPREPLRHGIHRRSFIRDRVRDLKGGSGTALDYATSYAPAAATLAPPMISGLRAQSDRIPSPATRSVSRSRPIAITSGSPCTMFAAKRSRCL